MNLLRNVCLVIVAIVIVMFLILDDGADQRFLGEWPR